MCCGELRGLRLIEYIKPLTLRRCGFLATWFYAVVFIGIETSIYLTDFNY
jgi:hypothetical protein